SRPKPIESERYRYSTRSSSRLGSDDRPNETAADGPCPGLPIARSSAVIVCAGWYVSLSGIGEVTSIDDWLPAPSAPGLRSTVMPANGPTPAAVGRGAAPGYALPASYLTPRYPW